jgi:tetratricopeptide (TPR) repeat protein
METLNPSESSYSKSRQVRVFISSTFQDMFAEREELVKFAFPELRRRCRERQVEFVDVDLRWGITDEQKADGLILPICLAEIDRCRPYFIGLLGERYGWVPQAIDEQLTEVYPWLKEHRQKSVTEIEILHGVLCNPAMRGHPYFYFRDPEVSKKVESELASQAGYLPELDISRSKLHQLKNKIRASGHPMRENFPDPKALGQMVIEDIWAILDKNFPPEEQPSALERTRQDHQAFAAVRTRLYIPSEENFRRLDEHVAGDGPPLVLLGESGSGKSALIANWAERYRREHPEDFMVQHFIGSSPESTDYIGLLHRVMEEIKERVEPREKAALDTTLIRKALQPEESQEIPTDPKKLVEVFPFWLAEAAAKGRFTLIIDALNQLEDHDNALHLKWLPEYFPPNLRVILSTLPGSSQQELEKRSWPTLKIASFGQVERRQLVTEYLSQFTKTLPSDLVDRIVTADQSANPLYLRALLEELRIYGDHVKLRAHMEDYLTAKTVDDLYEKILERYEKDYDRDRAGLVKEAMSLIWASRRGLNESELLDLLGSDKSPLPAAYWSPLYLAAEESLVNRSGLITFFHDFLRKAVEDRYLSDCEQKRLCHLRIADYFEKRGLDDRRVDELPWQLAEATEWKHLKECLTDLGMFQSLMTEAKRYELTGYWLKLEGRFDMTQAYNAALERYEKSKPKDQYLSFFFGQIGLFLDLNAKYDEAEPLYRRALAIDEKVLGSGHPDLANSLSSLAGLYYQKGDYGEAEPLYRRALAIREKVLGPEHRYSATSLIDLALLLEAKGDHGKAEQLYRRALAIHEKVLGAEHPGMIQGLNNLAHLLETKGDYWEAEPLYRRALAIGEKVLGPEHPHTGASLNNLAILLEARGDYWEAEPLYRRALAIGEKVLGPEHPNLSQGLNNLAHLLKSKGDYGEAELLYRRAMSVSEKVLGPEHPNTARILGNLAALLYEKHDYDGAEPLLRRALAIREKVLGSEHPDTAMSLNNLAKLFKAKGDCGSAEPFIRRALAIHEKVLGAEHPDLANSLSNLAGLFYQRGDYGGAEPLYRRALAIREKVLGPEHRYSATSLIDLALLLEAKGDQGKAEQLYRQALAINEKVLGPEHPDTATSLNNLATLLYRKGDHGKAELIFRRVQAICEKVLGQEHPETAASLNNLAHLLCDKGDYEKAEQLYRRAVAIYEKELGPEHPDTVTSLNNLAALLYKKGDYDGVEPLLRRALAIDEKVLGPEHLDTATGLNNLAYLLYAKGDYESAEPLYRRALAICEKVLGSEHPNTGANLNSLALLLEKKGEYEAAEGLYIKAVGICEKTLGPEHINTKVIQNNLLQLRNLKKYK